jgi:ABC-2 type transport system ATP-binding protein
LSAQIIDEALVAKALAALAEDGIRVAEFSLGAPSLDVVFFALTGRAAEETATVTEAAA